MILKGILSRMNLDCPVTVEESPDKIILNIKSNGGGLLIGRRGQNLDAIQYIVNKAVHKLTNGRKIIVVDTESYRQRREESLVALAAKIGEKVKITNKAVSLSYLNAHNRRIIHLALQNDANLTTKSRGEGEYRKIIIVPANKG
jgi:spoIIIJ-associated protein